MFRYTKLCPTKDILDKYKNNPSYTNEDYVKDYYEQVLNKLNPEVVIQELRAYGQDIVLVCYEKSDDFCHRHIVAEWLSEYENIQEW